MARMARADEVGVHTPKEQLMSDKATMPRETTEAFADLRAMFDWLTEEQASHVWLAVSGVRESLIHIREYPAQNRDWRAARTLQTAESTLAELAGIREATTRSSADQVSTDCAS